MFSEAIKLIGEMAVSASRPVKVLDESTSITYLAMDGATITLSKAHAPLNQRVDTLPCLVRRVMDAHSDDECTVWVADSGVTAVLDSSQHRHELIRWPYKVTPWFARAHSLDAQVDQASIIRLLNVHYRDTFVPTDLLTKLRRLRFDNGGAVTSVIKRGEESLGREIKSSVVAAEGEIPESVSLNFPVFDIDALDVDTRQDIACVLEIEASRGLFRLTPLPSQLDVAKRQALIAVRQAVEDAFASYGAHKHRDDIPMVYIGEP